MPSAALPSPTRSALAGDMARATAILGRPFAIAGEVIHGDKRGRTIGVPTLNIAIGDYMRPAYGVYATRTRLPDGRVVDGVASLARQAPVLQAHYAGEDATARFRPLEAAE